MNTPILDGICKEAGFDLYHKDSGALTPGGAVTIAGGGALGGSALVEKMIFLQGGYNENPIA